MLESLSSGSVVPIIPGRVVLARSLARAWTLNPEQKKFEDSRRSGERGRKRTVEHGRKKVKFIQRKWNFSSLLPLSPAQPASQDKRVTKYGVQRYNGVARMRQTVWA